MSTLVPNMEAINVPRMISGAAIIDDLLDRIEQRLAKDCGLRATDAYAGYSASVVIRIQVRDVDVTEIEAQIGVGTIDHAQEHQDIHISSAGSGSDDQPLGGHLEKPIDSAGFEEAPPAKRQYVSRVRAQRG
jgi:hypothetical protein